MAAKKEEKGPSMIETFQEFKETKNIDRTTLVSVLEESFRNVIAKLFGSDENFDVIVNPDKGDFEIHRNRVVVADGEVQDDGKKVQGVLKSVDGDDFVVTVKEKHRPEGKKRPVIVDVDKAYNMNNVKYTKYLLSFK